MTRTQQAHIAFNVLVSYLGADPETRDSFIDAVHQRRKGHACEFATLRGGRGRIILGVNGRRRELVGVVVPSGADINLESIGEPNRLLSALGSQMRTCPPLVRVYR